MRRSVFLGRNPHVISIWRSVCISWQKLERRGEHNKTIQYLSQIFAACSFLFSIIQRQKSLSNWSVGGISYIPTYSQNDSLDALRVFRKNEPTICNIHTIHVYVGIYGYRNRSRTQYDYLFCHNIQYSSYAYARIHTCIYGGGGGEQWAYWQ
jgi:hypothetical protein